MDAMLSVDESDTELMYMNMLEGICDGDYYHLIINIRETWYKIRACIKQGQSKWKEALLSTRNMGKILQKPFKAVVNKILQALSILGESKSEVLTSFHNLETLHKWPDYQKTSRNLG